MGRGLYEKLEKISREIEKRVRAFRTTYARVGTLSKCLLDGNMGRVVGKNLHLALVRFDVPVSVFHTRVSLAPKANPPSTDQKRLRTVGI